MTATPRPSLRRQEAGQAIVEFAIVAPVAFMLIFGLLSACYLFYQSSALHDGASAGARTASLETSLVTPSSTVTGEYCESGSPVSIEQAIASAAPALNVDTADPLCGTSSGSDDTGVTQLTQTGSGSSRATITVTCGGNCAAPTSVSVSLSYNAQGLAIPLSLTYTLHATSEVPILTP